MKLAVLLALALTSASPVPQEVTQPGAQEETHEPGLAELAAAIEKERDEVDPDSLETIGELETREAMQVLVGAYDTFASVYMRREVLRQLNRFDDVDGAYVPALGKLMNVSVGAKERELRTAALEGLGLCTQHGQTFLALIVESAAEEGIRERAMELHVRIGGSEHDEWYRRMYERTVQDVWQEAAEKREADRAAREEREREKRKERRRRRGKKGDDGQDDEEAKPEEKQAIAWPTPRIRSAAMMAIIESLSDEELLETARSDFTAELRRNALEELGARDHPAAVELAEQMLESVNYDATSRAFAAGVYLDEKGVDGAKTLMEVARNKATPDAVRQRVAELLSELDDDKVNDMLVKLVGKGKPAQKVFALRATRHIFDEAMVKKIRRDIRDRDEAVAVASIEALAARRDRESIDEMERVLERTRSEVVRAALLRALSQIYDGENAWVERLVGEYAASDDIDLRNAALFEVARLGRRSTVDLFLANLSHENWSTRLICLAALEAQRDAELLRPIVDQMQGETGRMAIEFGGALFRLTGQNFGKRAKAWAGWLDDPASDVEILDEAEVERLAAEGERRRLRQISNAEFFGIRIESHRVLFIIDVSGSMLQPIRARYVDETGPRRIDVAKEELVKAIKSLDTKALFNIAPFSFEVDSWLDGGIVSADDVAREDAILYAQSLVADGGTNLYGSLVFAFEDPDIDTIFLLSDGEPSVGELVDAQAIRDEIAERNATRGIVINTIAVGGQLEILEWLAQDSGGTHVEYQ